MTSTVTVKSLSEFEKNQIVAAYQAKDRTLKQLAGAFYTSPRTIGRVLEERGLATPVPRLKGEAHKVMEMLKFHGIDGPKGLADRLAGARYNPSTPPPAVPVNVEASQVMQLLKTHNLDLAGLTDILTGKVHLPIPTSVFIRSVQTYLNNCTKEELAAHFYTSGMAKLAEMARRIQANQQAQQDLSQSPASAKIHVEPVSAG